MSRKPRHLRLLEAARDVPLSLRERQAVMDELRLRYRRTRKREKGEILTQLAQLYSRLLPRQGSRLSADEAGAGMRGKRRWMRRRNWRGNA